MVTTNLVKWQPDGDSELTAYCDDDDTDTEIGPAKWDDTNNRLEINCNSVDSIVRWDDTGNNLESRTTDDGCCGCEGDCCECEKIYTVTITGFTQGACSGIDGVYFLTRNPENPCWWFWVDGNDSVVIVQVGGNWQVRVNVALVQVAVAIWTMTGNPCPTHTGIAMQGDPGLCSSDTGWVVVA